MQLSLRTLRYIVTAADTQNLTTAARQLNISQPSISAAINQAEAYLGIDIFVRHHARGVTLTVGGRSFINEARRLLKHAFDFNLSMQHLGHGTSGEITVGSFLTLATRFMPGLLAEFGRRAPSITIKLVEGNQQEITENLISGQIELALSYAYSLPDDIHSEPLSTLPPYILISEDHRLAGRKSVSIHEFADEPLILLDLPMSRDYFLTLFHSCQIEPKIFYRSGSYELIRGLVGHGHGYTIHNAIPGTRFAYDGSRTVVLPIEENLPCAQVTCLYLKKHIMRPAVKLFADFLHEAFADHGMFSPQAMQQRLQQ